MCDVCVADAALATSACKSKKCKAFMDGEECSSDTTEKVQLRHHPRWRHFRFAKSSAGRNARKPTDLVAAPSVFVRARGKSSEGPGTYQLRLEGESWPKKWTWNKDLASAMGLYGLDVKWKYRPEIVRDWILGKRKKMPTEQEIVESLDGMTPKMYAAKVTKRSKR